MAAHKFAIIPVPKQGFVIDPIVPTREVRYATSFCESRSRSKKNTCDEDRFVCFVSYDARSKRNANRYVWKTLCSKHAKAWAKRYNVEWCFDDHIALNIARDASEKLVSIRSTLWADLNDQIGPWHHKSDHSGYPRLSHKMYTTYATKFGVRRLSDAICFETNCINHNDFLKTPFSDMPEKFLASIRGMTITEWEKNASGETGFTPYKDLPEYDWDGAFYNRLTGKRPVSHVEIPTFKLGASKEMQNIDKKKHTLNLEIRDLNENLEEMRKALQVKRQALSELNKQEEIEQKIILKDRHHLKPGTYVQNCFGELFVITKDASLPLKALPVDESGVQTSDKEKKVGDRFRVVTIGLKGVEAI